MRQSEFFLKIQKEFPKDEVAANASFLIRGGFIEKLMAGVYSFLPLGLRVRERVMRVIREEMNALGGEEILMPALHPRSVWEKSGRWKTLEPIMYQFKDHSGKEVGLGTTHEEVIASLACGKIESYADLPKALYQIQTKFRDEPRAKSGLLRGREFTMKDLYSFHADEESLSEFYGKAKEAYFKVFLRCGLKTLLTEASGGDFSKEYSHEFMAPAEAGEDAILFCEKCHTARNKEITRADEKCAACGGKLTESRAIEVGNIFKLGTRFSEAAGLRFKDRNGAERPVIMASYGIGVERLIGTIVEIYHDEKGILWPEEVAPFTAHLLSIGKADKWLQKFGNQVYSDLVSAGVSTLFDERDTPPGEKLFEADFIGIPWRIVASERTMKEKKVELKCRSEDKAELVSVAECIKKIKDKR